MRHKMPSLLHELLKGKTKIRNFFLSKFEFVIFYIFERRFDSV